MVKKHKQQLRQQLCQQRRLLSIEEQQNAATNVQQQLINSQLLEPMHVIGAYQAHNGEIDPQPIIDDCRQQQKTCCLII